MQDLGDILIGVEPKVAEGLIENSPELQFRAGPLGQNKQNMALNVTKPPFDDNRVRKAMQMAIDIPTVSQTYYKGKTDPTPRGFGGPAVIGWFKPFDEWPEELQAEHTYNPEKAKALLDEAGYTPGADGIRFKTTYHINDSWVGGLDVGWAQIVASYLAEIGIELEINQVEFATFMSMLSCRGENYDGMVVGLKGNNYPVVPIVPKSCN